MLKVAVLVSGGGTNLQAIIDAIDNKVITDTEIVAVISNNKNAFALERAKKVGIAAEVVSPKDYADRARFNEALLAKLQETGADLIVLAGYLVVIPEIVIDAYPNKIVNIHPSLIPAFCGTGYMYFAMGDLVYNRRQKLPLGLLHHTLLQNLWCISILYCNRLLHDYRTCVSAFIYKMNRSSHYLDTSCKGCLMNFKSIVACSAECRYE